MIKILYEDNHVIVVVKPVNVPVQLDDSKDIDLLTMLKSYLKEKYHKPGNVYLGLVHRLDRPVSGIMVFAKTSKAATRLSEQIRMHQVIKKYYAVVEGKFACCLGSMRDKLLKNSKTNMTIVSSKGKEAVLNYKILDFNNGYSLADIDLITGRSHQIRVQFCSRNHPLYGDQRYNKNAKVGEQIALFSYYLSFIHPVTKEKMEFKEKLPSCYPWSLF